LLVAQLAALTHLDLDGHSRDSLCAICHATSELGAAAVATPGFALSAMIADEPAIAALPTHYRSTLARSASARAPPAVS
jgi:hypothetical protein